ncbi:MAG: MarR family transcriptional regulator, organic hydroperoxide resistance regulator, partial [Microbacteriaceae bacterium]|nr:MarR family transcriptional regulator, organic hydroperoxide resistance regulator [Microbacteriaceae bacterium]
RVTDISDTLFLEPATLSPLLKRLETAGLVTRARSAEDGRALAVELTEKGAALRKQAEEVPGKIVARLGVPQSDLQSIRGALTRLISAATV